MSVEGELKKLINFLRVKHNDQMLYTSSFKPTSMWINDVQDSISERIDEAKKEFPKYPSATEAYKFLIFKDLVKESNFKIISNNDNSMITNWAYHVMIKDWREKWFGLEEST